MRDHLVRFHRGAAAHHDGLSREHAEASSACLEVADATKAADPMHGCMKRLAKVHERLASRFDDFKAFHESLAKGLGGLSDSDELPDVNEIRNTGLGGHEGDELKAYRSRWGKTPVNPMVRGVLPDAPRHTLVPRPGGPGAELEDSTAAIDKIAR